GVPPASDRRDAGPALTRNRFLNCFSIRRRVMSSSQLLKEPRAGSYLNPGSRSLHRLVRPESLDIVSQRLQISAEHLVLLTVCNGALRGVEHWKRRLTALLVIRSSVLFAISLSL